jgi:asparagine synthase (glutamine-hydrolysing)
MAMAHSVEGRYPFLDHRVVAFACSIPPRLRMKVLREKHILKRAMSGQLPPEIVERKKQPYMAPDIASFSGHAGDDLLQNYLSEDAIAASGLFRPKAVQLFLAKCRKNQRQGFRENMAFVGILSTQILYDRFVRNFSGAAP